ncbi:acyl carrier protein [Sinisalibacter aestuarii]|uniref:Carrier domain-containing protein n=1 Tax=Sinisalibacter aestuarii TaxID=2949426 RepID=A0ABQ5LTS1_9RHOB|nr:acyl carrier protein [Sinisalibacter aestuarii]GKY88008.1 hypothetical protein STA1M1_18770 [Sinisalibacter aestuarii]
MSVETRIREIISDVVEGFDGAALNADAELLDTGLDSLDIASVLLEVQEEFGVIVPDGEEDKYDTLAKLVAFVSEKQSS